MRQGRTKKSFNLLNYIRFIGYPLYTALISLLSVLLIIITIVEELYVTRIRPAVNKLLQKKPVHPHLTLPPLRLPKLTLPNLTIQFKLKLPRLPKLPPIKLPKVPSLTTLPTNAKKPARKKTSTPTKPLHKFGQPTLPHPSLKLPLRRILLLLPVMFVLIGSSAAFYFFVLKDLPKPQDLLNREQPITTKIYDRNGRLLYKIYKDENRTIVRLSDIPPHVIAATLSIEDANFYNHVGFSIKGIVRAFTKNVKGDTLQGGSTITQQLVKNALLNSERTFTRKLKEVLVAISVENYFTKDEILNMYFNEVPYGGTAYGIEAASQMYFGKSIRDLNLAEAALLAGLPASPTVYSPFGAQPELATLRQHQVLNRMVEDGHITPDIAEKAKTTPLNFAPPRTDILAPHFVMYVKDILVKEYGEQQVNQGGLEVYTSLDLDIQELAEQAMLTELEKLRSLNVKNAAVLITKPSTGEILAMVGSRNYFDTKNDGQVNVIIRPRQPGSSIKPVNYALALENGYTAATIIDDSPVVYRLPGSPPYAPQNYDGRFHGKVTVRQALANSYNIPAVKTLSQFGVSKMVGLAKNMGISTWTNPSRFGLSLTLGGGEVKMIDMAVVYGAFANGGIRVDLNPIQKVTNFFESVNDNFACHAPSENVPPVMAAEESTANSQCQGTRVLSPETSFIISNILADNQARSAAFGTHSVLNIPNHQVAVKTGTTNDLRDNWTIGYTSEYLVASWVGNNDNTPMSRVASGITGASPIWSQVMTALLRDKSTHGFVEPTGVVKATICVPTQTLACAGCPQTRTEYFKVGTEPKSTCKFEPKSEDGQNREPIDKILEGLIDRLD